MSTQQDTNILFPPARVVQGDLYEPQTEDQQGNKLTVKTGQNAGQERVNYFFTIAIPKAGEAAWYHSAWGQKIYGLARSWWPTLFDAAGNCLHPRFSWKVSDGDDTTPNPDAQMRRNCDREGFPGCWIVRLSSGYATRILDSSGAPMLTPGAVKRGFWVEVWASLNTNGNTQKPGIYVNHQYVAFRAPDKEIISGPDPRSLGFGKAALPPGVSAAPVAGANLPQGIPGVPGVPAGVPGLPAGIPAGVPSIPHAAPIPQAAPIPGGIPTGVAPNAGFIAPPLPGAAPAIPAVPTVPAPPAADPLGAPAGFRMANMNGPSYSTMTAGGWTQELMLQHGHLVRL